MKSNEKEIVINLRKLLKEMYNIIVLHPNNDISYGKRTIIGMIQYIEMNLTNDIIEFEQLVGNMRERYKSMFPPRGGLSEFYIWDDSYEARYKANHEYEQIKSKIEAILSKSQ